ncbi:(S)-benzoin forming benzil reductase [Bacillus sp. DJP31]|uniref:(S)-benzoin forming benzil reductase n=1 Tax=Bacillus sp. DJP31 TaxID=3409789 RepID=UPI003BB637BE
MNYYIVTGASRGLGESIVKQLLLHGNKVLCLSRSMNSSLIEAADKASIDLSYYQVDITDIVELEALFGEILKELQIENVESITLINNAGVIEPITTVGMMASTDLKVSVETNLLAPMILTNLFIQFLKDHSVTKVVVNISSGAANSPYSGWSAYCSTKAGLDMFTKTVGLEQQKGSHPTTIISFSPGIMDTGMQTTIRSKTKDQFETIEKFLDYKDHGMLRSSDFVAEVLLGLLDEEDLINGKVYDIKQLI